MAKLLQTPRPYLCSGILFFASLGAYTVSQQPFDLFLLLLFGLLGSALRRFGIPVIPLILGVILGPLMEVKLREALALSDGDASGLVTRSSPSRHGAAEGRGDGPAICLIGRRRLR